MLKKFGKILLSSLKQIEQYTNNDDLFIFVFAIGCFHLMEIIQMSKYIHPLYSEHELAQCDFVDKFLEHYKQNLSINMFVYIRAYWDFSVTRYMSSRQAMLTINARQQEKPFTAEDFRGLPMPFGQEYIFQSEIDKNSPYYLTNVKPYVDKFNARGSVTKCRYHVGYTELFSFISPVDEVVFERNFLRDKVFYDKFISAFLSKNRDKLKGMHQHAQKVQVNSDIFLQGLINVKQYYNKKKNTVTNPDRFYIDPESAETYLTKKEMICLHLLMDGYKHSDISSQLGISVRTVDAHLNNVKLKLNCSNKTNLVTHVIKNNLLNWVKTNGVENKVSSVASNYFDMLNNTYTTLAKEHPKLYSELSDVTNAALRDGDCG